jgi:hypothetical protein
MNKWLRLRYRIITWLSHILGVRTMIQIPACDAGSMSCRCNGTRYTLEWRKEE